MGNLTEKVVETEVYPPKRWLAHEVTCIWTKRNTDEYSSLRRRHVKVSDNVLLITYQGRFLSCDWFLANWLGKTCIKVFSNVVMLPRDFLLLFIYFLCIMYVVSLFFCCCLFCHFCQTVQIPHPSLILIIILTKYKVVIS